MRKIPERQRKQIEHLIEMIMGGKTTGLDIKKLRGAKNVYRARKGDIRIIYHFSDGEIVIIAIEKRSDTTYNIF